VIALVGSAGTVSATTPVTVTRTTAAGNLLVALCSRTSATDVFTTITDTAGNTWTPAVVAPTSGSVGRRVEIWYCANAASITTLSAAFSGAAPGAVTLHEFSGAATASVVDAAFGKVQAATTGPTAAQVTPTQTDDLVIGFIRANAGVAQTYTLDAGSYTAITVPIAEHHGIAYQIGPTSGAATGPTWTLGTSTGSGSATVAFKVAATPTSGAVKHWNGSAWVDANATTPVKYWNGSTWVSPPAGKIKTWTGSTWDVAL
jgi:hypothetical protein